MLGRANRPSTSEGTLTSGRTRLAVMVGGAFVLLGGAFAVVAQAASFAATASLAPQLRYINDPAGSVYAFTVKNTGTSASIGAVQITRPSTMWSVTSCPTPPVGWTTQASSTMCRFRSAATTSDNIKPGQTRVFNVKAKGALSSTDQVGTWKVVVSKSNQFDNTSLLTTAGSAGSGLTTTLYTFEVVDAVVADGPVPVGGACPLPKKDAVLGSTKTIVICGRNRAKVALTPTAARSSLGGTFIAVKGTFASGSIVPSTVPVVLGQWNNTKIVGTYGTGYKVIAGIGSAANRTSPLRTFTGYKATSQPPMQTNDAYDATEDTQLVKNAADGVLANDSDVEGDPMTATLVDDVDHGTLVLNSDGSFTYTPAANYNGTDTFTYKANDPYGSSSPATVTITVAAVQDAPDAVDDTATTSEDASTDVTVLANDTEVDGETLSIDSVDDTGTAGSVTIDGTKVVYDPNGQFESLDTGQIANDSFTYTVSDGNGGTDTATVTMTITGLNDAPNAVDDPTNTDENTPVNVDVLTNDSDAEGHALTVTADDTGLNGALTETANGQFTYSPDGQYEGLDDGDAPGTDSFTYTVSDGNGGSDTATVTFTIAGVNDAPTAHDKDLDTNEDTPAAVALTGDDVDGEPITSSIVTGPAHGSLGSVVDGVVTYTPDANYNGPDSFTYRTNDGTVDSAVATVTIDVASVNDAPVAGDDEGTTAEDTALVVTAPGVLADDSDTEGSPLTAVLVTGPAHGSLTLNADGSYTYTPTANYFGADSFTYRADDGDTTSNLATVTLDVTSVNDAPTAGDQPLVSTPEDTAKVVTLTGGDADGDTITYSIVTGPTHGSLGAVVGDQVTYTPDANYFGPDSFTYKSNDTALDSAVATVTIDVTSVNDAPVAANDAHTTAEDTQLTVNAPGVLGNDSDVESPLTAVLVTGPAHGTLTLNTDGSFTYTPATNYNGSDSFTYKANDGTADSNTATVALTVDAVNDNPVADADSASVSEDSTGSAIDVLDGDTDVEGQTLTVSGVDQTGTTGVVTNNGTDVTYDPNGMFEYLDDTETATDTFTYTVQDTQGGTDTETVTITVTGANDAPVAADDGPFQAIQNQNIMLTTPGVLANDIDADGEALTAGNASDPANGTVTLNPDGSFSYDPDTGFTGTDTFTYDVSDGTATDTATVTINVVPPNATPTADATSGSGIEDGAGIVVTLTGHDADGDALTFTAGTATNGLVSVPGSVTCDSNVPSLCSASVTYTPNANFFGSDSFTYTVNDGTIDSAPATASITVDPVNDQPSFTKGGDQTVNEDSGAQTVTGWATAVSAGPANESAQTVTFAGSTTNDALFAVLPAVSSTGDLTYTPAVNANGTATVTIQATDDGGIANGGNNQSPTQQFDITVTAVNDAPSFTKGADQVLFEDAGAQSVSNWASAISKGPADESAQTVSFTTSNDNNALFSTQPGVSPTGTLTYTSAPNAVGTATVTISISDTGGTANGGDDTSDSQTFTVTVNAVNDEPSLTHDGSQTVLEDAGAQTVNGFVNTTSAGPADESAQTVTVSVTGQTNAALFSVLPSIDSAGTLTYTPAVNANGTSTVTIRAADDGGTANGGDDTGPNMTFDITVTAVNDAPSFTKGADQTLNEDAGAQSVSGWATAISEGPANEAAQDVTFTVTNDNNSLFVTQPAVSPTGTLTYTSAANQYGSATVTVFISDNGGTANGGDDTSDTQTFLITVNPVNDAPVAAAKNFTVQANMKLSLSGLLVGATDPNDSPVPAGQPAYTPSFTLGSITLGAGCVGCTVSNVDNANGTFDFDPPAGQAGTFTATYTVVDSGYPAPGVASAAQTITFTVNGPVIHFVDTTAGAGGTGRLSAPFNTLPAATTAMGTDVNERIFVRGGNVSGNVTLPTDGWILSEAVTGTSFDTVMGITPPAGTIARPAVNGTQRTLSGSVTVGTNSNVRGFDLTPPSGTPGLVGSGKTGLVVNQITATTTNARAVDLSGSSGVLTFTRVSSTGATRGISLLNTNVSTGSFTITGTGSAGSGGTITTSTAQGTNADGAGEGGIYLNGTKNVSLDRMIVTANQASGIYGNDVTTFTLANSTVSNNGTQEALDHDGIRFENMLGTSSLSAVTVFGSREDNVGIVNKSGTATLTVSNSTFRDNNASVGANGLYVDASNSANVTFTSTNNTFQRNHTSGLAIFGQSSVKMNATVTGGTYVTDNGVGLDIEANGSGGMQFSVSGGTVTGCVTCGAPVVVYKGTSATGTGTNAFAGTVSGMTVTNGNSTNAPGIWVHGEGPGATRLAITGNNVSQVAHYGILVSFGSNSSVGQTGPQNVDVSVTNNVVNPGTTLGTLEGIFVDSGLLTADTTAMCAHVQGNNVTNTSDDDIRVRNRMAGTAFRLPGYAGGATDMTAVQNFLLAQNTAADTFASRNAGNSGFTGGAACAAP